MDSLVDMISKYGFPVVAACGLGYFVYYIWKWVTTEIKPVIEETTGKLIGLIDKVRMLDNDMIRMNTKLAMVLERRSEVDVSLTKAQKDELNHIINKYLTSSDAFNLTGKK